MSNEIDLIKMHEKVARVATVARVARVARVAKVEPVASSKYISLLLQLISQTIYLQDYQEYMDSERTIQKQ
jgi:hypothetical protein